MPDSMAFKMFEMHNSLSASCFCVRPCRRRYSTRQSMILAQFSDIAVNLLRERCQDSRYRGRDRLCCSRPCCCQRVGRYPTKYSVCHPNRLGGSYSDLKKAQTQCPFWAMGAYCTGAFRRQSWWWACNRYWRVRPWWFFGRLQSIRLLYGQTLWQDKNQRCLPCWYLLLVIGMLVGLGWAAYFSSFADVIANSLLKANNKFAIS